MASSNSNKKYQIWTSNKGNRVENNTINMNNSQFKQTSYGFACRNIVTGNKFHLKDSTIEQNCVIIFKNGFGKKPFVTTIKRTIK